MPLNDIDLTRRHCSIDLPLDKVEFIVYSYNKYSFEERSYESVHELIQDLNIEIDNNNQTKERFYWIEVINGSSIDFPQSLKIFCEYFHIHPLTMEDITTVVSYMALNLFANIGALHLLMKILTWNGERVQQQQISFYLRCSNNLLITFQEKTIGNVEPVFQAIRNRLRRQQNNDEGFQQPLNSRLRQLNVDYLFYCLLDDIIDRYIFVMEEVSNRLGHFDEILMSSQQSRTLETLLAIYNLKHDLLHIRILFNPLKEIISRLQRATPDDHYIPYPRQSQVLKLGLKHHIVRKSGTPIRQLKDNNSMKITKLKSIYLNEYIYVYLNDLNDHVNQLIDSVEIQRENVSILISFWITLTSNEIGEILKILALMTVLFMPCNLLTGLHATNFHTQPEYKYYYGYFILLAVLAVTLCGMLLWYKIKRWI